MLTQNARKLDSTCLISKSFPQSVTLEEIILEAKKNFVDGQTANFNKAKSIIHESKKYPADIKIDEFELKNYHATLQENGYRLDERRGRYLSRVDSAFKYNATRIPESHLIAAEGPQGLEKACHFIDDMIFNSNCLVNQIIVLVEKLGNPGEDIDCSDYFTQSWEAKPFKIHATSKMDHGSIQQKEHEKQLSTNPPALIKSQLRIQNESHEKILSVSAFGVSDNCPLNLSKDTSGTLKAEVWRLHQMALTNNVAIHCRAGVGRTGHFILMLEILRHYDEIFKQSNAKTSAIQIQKIINRIRESRPALVWNEAQLELSIRNAHAVYQYILTKENDLSDKIREEKTPELDKKQPEPVSARPLI